MAKSQSSQSGGQEAQLLSMLASRSCPHCPDGELEQGVYKDNRAIVCDTCETPRVQLW
ncbi:HVO_A0556 family zinc finger protein [Halosolutus amylolyticus]|uniref:HVO_A0556 family zinc finger protein n=1 Tax=Halosolutus amylolyticus TaxID=2932267 RepID=A0ABD5PTF1_9EURY|nr:HVO_A0556 family zinc finger protein [Halosolutus amylolyticus]